MSGDTLTLRIVSVVQETANAKTYELELVSGEKPQYKPGQFLTFILNNGRQEIRRSYSILSLPEEPLKITVKKVENGMISRHILQHWKEGKIVKSLRPAGRFTLGPEPEIQRDIFCFAAGSGIVPILPQIKMLLKNEPKSIIHLIYSNSDEDDALFLNDVENLATNNMALHAVYLFSDPKQRPQEQGRLNNLNAEELINNELRFKKDDAVFLICGPFTYMRMLNFTIGLMHFKKENIRRENYLPDIMRSSLPLAPLFPDRKVLIKIGTQSHSIMVPSGKSILDAALANGIELPYSCKGGVCGNCAAKCKWGGVSMTINEVLTEADLQQGWVLTCTGYPSAEYSIINFNNEQ